MINGCVLRRIFFFVISITTCITCSSCVSWNTAQTCFTHDATPILQTVLMTWSRAVFSKIARIRTACEWMYGTEMIEFYNAKFQLRIWLVFTIWIVLHSISVSLKSLWEKKNRNLSWQFNLIMSSSIVIITHKFDFRYFLSTGVKVFNFQISLGI